MLSAMKPAPADPILGLTEAFNADPNPVKVNLGVGIYQDEQGRTPALPSVKAAETAVVGAETTKAYLPIPGPAEFSAHVGALVFADHAAMGEGRVKTAYAPGGTGALRVGAELLRLASPKSSAWVTAPTWPNHKGLFSAAGFEVKELEYYDPARRAADADRFLEKVSAVPAGDVVVLHLCCHNPTGADLDAFAWQALARSAKERGWIPFIDAAYIGFGDGLEPDRAPLKVWLDAGVDLLVASSFSKNMGLYRERAGALSLVAASAAGAEAAFSHLKRVIRVLYSNAVGHASQTVARLLGDEMLRSLWMRELDGMRGRIHAMRSALAEGLSARGAGDFGFVTRQRGMFSFSGLTPAQVDFLRSSKAIYMTGDGRINVAGLNARNLDYVCDSLAEAKKNV
jgi:aspartate aminotransferase/aromatic-amino-acid transaminase